MTRAGSADSDRAGDIRTREDHEDRLWRGAEAVREGTQDPQRQARHRPPSYLLSLSLSLLFNVIPLLYSLSPVPSVLCLIHSGLLIFL